MEIALGNSCFFNLDGVRLVVCIGVQCLVCNDMVLKKSPQIFLSVFAEQEAIDPGTELLKSEIRRCEKGAANVIRRIIDSFKETGLLQTELESAELAREELDDVGSFRWGDQEAINTVNDTVGSKLHSISLLSILRGTFKSYNINGHDPTIKVDSQAFETNVGAHSLCLSTNILAIEQCWDSVGDQDSTCRVKI